MPEHALTPQYPLILNTGRVRDHWHTMTRTGKSARLSAHMAEPYAEINTADALRFKVRNGELATLRSHWGSMVVRVRAGTEAPVGMVFAPIHWNRAFASDARVGALTNPVVDPISGEPELKHTPVSIEHFRASWFAVMLTRSALPPPVTQWWTKVQGEKFVRYELAGNHSRDWSLEARRLLGVPAGEATSEVDWIEYRDPSRRVYRAAWFVRDRLEGCIYFDRKAELPERAWLARLFTMGKLDAALRASLMAGSCARRRRSGRAGVFVLWRRKEPHRRLRTRDRARRHRRRDRQTPQMRHELWFLRAGDPDDHRRDLEAGDRRGALTRSRGVLLVFAAVTVPGDAVRLQHFVVTLVIGLFAQQTWRCQRSCHYYGGAAAKSSCCGRMARRVPCRTAVSPRCGSQIKAITWFQTCIVPR
jgi:formylmethanofuran dehydrogenase subunit D